MHYLVTIGGGVASGNARRAGQINECHCKERDYEAEALSISARTVELHNYQIMEVRGFHSIAERSILGSSVKSFRRSNCQARY